VPTVHLIDASPYIFRSYFSVPATVVDRAGNPANAVHGFTTFLLRYLAEERPTHALVAFDRSLTTSFRNEIYPDYKAQRELPPPELEAQQRDCMAVAEAMGFPVAADERFEADDLIATALERCRRTGVDFVVVSSDKDLAQLVGEDAVLFDFAKDVRYDAAAVEAKFGVGPDRIVDLLALAGDAVDNIPGVRGIGPKTAVALLAALGSLEAIYANLDAVASLDMRGAAGVRRKLEAHRELAFLSRRLATVARDAPVKGSLAAFAIRPPDEGALDALFDRLGFGGLRRRIGQSGAGAGESPARRK
jgi:DNA polymerase I